MLTIFTYFAFIFTYFSQRDTHFSFSLGFPLATPFPLEGGFVRSFRFRANAENVSFRKQMLQKMNHSCLEHHPILRTVQSGHMDIASSTTLGHHSRVSSKCNFRACAMHLAHSSPIFLTLPVLLKIMLEIFI